MIDILVVDDSLFSRSSVSHSLSGHGYRPILCANAEEALEKLKGLDSPRLVICDWVMEKLSGLDLCRAVRSAHAFPYVYFILLTARTCKVDIAAAVNAGVDDCLTKPCGEVDLVARVNVGRRLLEQLEEIGRQHHHSQMLLAGTPFGVACIDEHGKVVGANPAFSEMLGFSSPADIEGHSLASNLGSRVDFNALLSELALSEGFDAVPVVLQTRDGLTITARLWGRPVTIEGRHLYHISTDFSLPQ